MIELREPEPQPITEERLAAIVRDAHRRRLRTHLATFAAASVIVAGGVIGAVLAIPSKDGGVARLAVNPTESADTPSSPASSPPGRPVSALPAAIAQQPLLEVTTDNRLVITGPGTETTPRQLPLRGVPGGPSLVATNPAGGWVVTYTPDTRPTYVKAKERLALVSTKGAVKPFGPIQPRPVTSLAVSSDGSKVAVALVEDHSHDGPEIDVQPLPGRTGIARRWVVSSAAKEQYVNLIESLSWTDGDQELTYLAGNDTGAGISSPLNTLNTLSPSDVAPVASPVRTGCQIDAAAWLGSNGRLAEAAHGCSGPHQEVIHTAPTASQGRFFTARLPGRGCGEPLVHDAGTSNDALVVQCESAYVVAQARLTRLATDVQDAAFAG